MRDEKDWQADEDRFLEFAPWSGDRDMSYLSAELMRMVEVMDKHLDTPMESRWVAVRSDPTLDPDLDPDLYRRMVEADSYVRLARGTLSAMADSLAEWSRDWISRYPT